MLKRKAEEKEPLITHTEKIKKKNPQEKQNKYI
jgi:hypothetical protein